MKKIILSIIIIFITQITFSQAIEKFNRNKLDVFYDFIDNNFDKKLIKTNQKLPLLFYIDDDGKLFDLTFKKDSDTLITNEIKKVFDKMPYWDMNDQTNKFILKVTLQLLLNKDEKIKGATQMNWYNKDSFVKQNDLDVISLDKELKVDINEPQNEPLSLAGVEVKPEYPGGINEFYNFIGKKFKTPKSKDFKGGKIFVQFVIEKDGSLTEIKVLKHPGFKTDKEAIRVLEKSPLWKPAEQNGKKVRCQYVLPINIISN